MSIIITGPQESAEEVGWLTEMAGLLDAHTATCPNVVWVDVTALYRLTGWEHSPLARADVMIADLYGVEIVDLAQ
ncbi:hypothetical protein ACH4OV_25465 [Streptomyces diastaticus]|uniref:hypothetical protein n=1 Tax=Streptomyces diastaticus TaxID=1956 RepID=UPI00379DED9D